MGKVLLFTDGAARGNPDGPGGYGAVLQFTDSKGQLHEKTLSAGYVRTTNNRMELMADRGTGGVKPALRGGAVFGFQVSDGCI